MLKLVLTLALLTSCGTWLDPWHKPKKRTGAVNPLDFRLAKYCSEMPFVVAPDDGDSLYFTGFARTACNRWGMADFTNRPGRYQRWAEATGIKWNDPKESDPTKTKARSENSRDGYLAVMWNAWAAGDLKTLEEIRDWGRSRNWFMGDGNAAGFNTVFTPTIRSTLAQMIYRLGGENDLFDRNLPASWSNSCTDYECWLLATHILLRGEAYGHISSDALAALRAALAQFPENPVYQWAVDKYTTGEVGRSVELLITSPWHFHNRSATDRDYCEEWPYRRNRQSNSLKNPCPGKKGRHSGADWAFAAWLIQRG